MNLKVERHIRVLSALYFATAVAGWVVLVILLREGLMDMIASPTFVDQIAALLTGVIAATPIFAPVIAAAVGLVRRREWARKVLIGVSAMGILAFFLIITFPLGVYGLIVLTGPRARAYFNGDGLQTPSSSVPVV